MANVIDRPTRSGRSVDDSSNTPTKERYLALTTNEVQEIRYMIGKKSHRHRNICAVLVILQIAIFTAYASLSQRVDLQENQELAYNWLLLLYLILLRSHLSKIEIRRIKSTYFNKFVLSVNDL